MARRDGGAANGHDRLLQIAAGGVERVDGAGELQTQVEQVLAAIMGRLDKVELRQRLLLNLLRVEEAVEFAALMADATFVDQRATLLEDRNRSIETSTTSPH